MAQFTYRAKAGPGEVKTGVITADNQAVVVKRLRQEGLFPVSIVEVNAQVMRISSIKINSNT